MIRFELNTIIKVRFVLDQQDHHRSSSFIIDHLNVIDVSISFSLLRLETIFFFRTETDELNELEISNDSETRRYFAKINFLQLLFINLFRFIFLLLELIEKQRSRDKKIIAYAAGIICRCLYFLYQTNSE